MTTKSEPEERAQPTTNAGARCAYCKSNRTVKRGFSPTRERGKQQRFLCRNCGRTFIPDVGFWKMKTSEKIVTMSVDMYLSNLSSRKMRNQLQRHMSVKRHHGTILKWVYKYVLKVQRFVDCLKPCLSGEVYADETEVDCQNRNDVFWCAVDWGTRFIRATLYAPNAQNLDNATEFMNKIAAHGKPKFIQTDGLPFYRRAFWRIFQKEALDPTVQHRINNVKLSKKHNVRIETVFSKIKGRVHDFRGFKALWSAPILMAGIVLQHNFIEKHSTTGKVPCELAGLELRTGEDRWMGLIRISACAV